MPYTKLTIQEITDLMHIYNSSVTLQETRGLLRSQFSQLLNNIGFKKPRNNYELVHNYIQEKVEQRRQLQLQKRKRKLKIINERKSMNKTIQYFRNSYDEDLQNYRKEQEIEREKEIEREREQRETDERLKRMAERLFALEQEPDINIVDLLKTFEEELWEMINLYKHGQIIEYGNLDMILLTQPINMELLYNVVTDFRDRIADKVVIAADQDSPQTANEVSIKNSPTLEFYKNDIKNYKDCDKFLDKVFEQESRRPFKISFDFGTVIQRSEPKSQDGTKIPKYSIVDEESDKIVSYRINRPEVNKSIIHIPSIIVSKQNLNDYKKYVYSTIIQMQERTIVDTQEMFVAIFSMLICVYRLPYNSAGFCNECQKIHKNRKEIRYVDCQYNYMICFWTAYSFIVMPDRKGKFLHPTSRVALAKKELFQYYNVKRQHQREFLVNYPGFNFATDAEEISRRLNLNINIYQYIDTREAVKPINRRIDESNDIQNPFYQFLCSYHNTSINDEGEETDKNSNIMPRELLQSKIASNPTEFNILLVTDDCGNSHIMYIADVNELLGIKICPICKVHAIPAHDKYSHVKRKMDAHMKKCKENKQLLLENAHLKLEYDGQIIKRVVLEKYPKPYAPHILQNKSYKYLLANNRVNEVKPIKFYISNKFFTLDRKINKKCGEFSFQHANLEPLCVASTIKTKNKIKIIYFDNRTVNFIDEWLKMLFEEAKQVKFDNKYQDENIPQGFDVPVLGWDSSKFDTSLIFRNIHSNQYVISKYIGSGAHPKQIVVKNKEHSVTLKFIDAKSYLAPNMEYDAFIKDIGKVVLNKPVLPEEYFNCDNYQTELDKSEAFPIESFINQLKNSSISISEYNNYVKKSESFVSRWNYMRHCMEQDTQMMLHPIDNMNEFYFEFKVDMLLNTSLAKNSCQVKYSFVYKDFDLSESYNDTIYDSQDPKDDEATERSSTTFGVAPLLKASPDVKSFILTPQYWQLKVNDYNEQDKRQKRNRKHNITVKDYEYFKKLFITHTCHMCQSRFNYKNKPTLDRIDNAKAHTKANVLPCCLYCNKYASNRDKNEARLMIQLRRFALKYGLPMTISDQQVYKLCRRDLTGGISYVAHRQNIAGETKINKFIYDKYSNSVHSFDLPHVMTHVYSLDFNSLYASVMSSEQYQSIPYTNHRLYMPGYVLERVDNDQQRMRNIIYNEYRFSDDEQVIDKHVQLFIAEIKAHIHEDYINDQIDLPVIWRNLTITTSEQDIGKYTYKQLIDNGMQHDIEERKLTMLSSTHGQFMSFSNHYLWLLIDRFHLIIDEIRCVTTFSKHCEFNEFVNIFVNRRCKAIYEGNQSMNQLCKLTLNTSFGYDSLNTEKYQNIKLCNKDNIRQTHLLGTFVSEKQLSDDLYAVQLQPYNCSCSTPLQVAYFTMDNTKYYYLNTYYNFIMQTIDVNRIHYIYGDTDSMCFAVAGDEAAGIHQGLKYVISDQQLYNETYYQFLPRDADLNEATKFTRERSGCEAILPTSFAQSVYEEKKINGLTVQSEGSACIALAAKCYYINTDEVQIIKLKGVNQKQNKNIDFQKAFHTSIDSNAITTVENTSLIQKNGQISRITQNKIGISGINTKAIVLQNQSCAPYLYGVPASNYVIDNEL